MIHLITFLLFEDIIRIVIIKSCVFIFRLTFIAKIIKHIFEKREKEILFNFPPKFEINCSLIILIHLMLDFDD